MIDLIQLMQEHTATADKIRQIVGDRGQNLMPTAQQLITIMLIAMQKGGIQVDQLHVHHGEEGFSVDLRAHHVPPSRIIQ